MAGEHGGWPQAAADQPDLEGPGETPSGDRGADVRPRQKGRDITAPTQVGEDSSASPAQAGQALAWVVDNGVELIFLPTCGSWLTWIEVEFAALRYFALNGTGHGSHDEHATIAAYVRWRSTRAEPKTNLAPDSPIRAWTHSSAKAA
ncbi:hypothetical protein ACE1OA_00955 [Streptomyces sp. JL2001]|uniref:hypothetical protein n=1 Tax=Streptomyces sp. JL2001 TaxID=3342488 RepID=UPI003D8005D7